MNKVLSCILSFMPAVLVFGALLMFFVFYLIAGDESTMTAAETIIAFLILGIEFIGVILTFVLMVWYMVKACKNPYLSTGMKVLWCFLLYFFNLFIYPVFWFIYIRKE